MDILLQRVERTARRHPALAIALLRRVEKAARDSGDSPTALDALYQRYFLLERLGEAGSAIDDLYAGLQLAEDLSLPHQAGRMLEAIGRVRYTRGEYREAMHHWGRCIDLFGVTGDTRSGVEARIGLGAMYAALGDHVTGARFHRDARALLAGADNPYLASKLALNLGVSQRAIGQADSAVAEFEFALGEATRGGIREYVAESHWHLGLSAQDAGDLARAEQLMRVALQEAAVCCYAWLSAAASNSLAQLFVQQGRLDDARAAYDDALAAAVHVGSRTQQSACQHALSTLAERRGDMAAALRHDRAHLALELEIKAELSAPDRLRTMQQYDLSEKPPVQRLLELSSAGALQAGELDAALQNAASAAAGILRIELAIVWLRDEPGGAMLCRALHGPLGLPVAPGRPLPAAEMPCYAGMQHTLREALVVHDLRLHPAAAELHGLLAAADIRSLLELPLRLHGQTVGVASFGQGGQRRNWTREDVLFGSHIAHHVEHLLSDAQHIEVQAQLERRVAERTAALQEALRALEESSLTDPLTGLRNRRFLLQHLDHDAVLSLRRYESKTFARPVSYDDADITMFMVDLDHFKQVNDTHGHHAGDTVLVQIKERLQRVFRESDYLVRWGGEEFLIVARGTARGQAHRLAERVRATIGDEAFVLDDGTRLAKTCSVGFACYPFVVTQPRALGWQDVIALTDMALYAAKRAGRNAWVGVGATGRTDPATLLAALKSAPAEALREQQIVLLSNLDPARVADAV